MFQNRIKSAGGFVLIFVLVACSSATPTETMAPPTTTPTRIPPTATHTAIPPTATVLPSRIPPTPTATLPAPSPLNANGPWLVHGAIDSNEIFLNNLDGTGFLRIELPWLAFYSVLSSPNDEFTKYYYEPGLSIYNRNLATARVFENGYLSRNIRSEVKRLITRLPEGEIVRELPLIAAEAWPAIEAYENTEGITSILYDAGSHWSPDGRYYAYSAISTGTTVDIHVYDALLDQVRVLTDGPAHEVIDRWTHDGQRILYQSGESLDHVWGMGGTQFIGSVSLGGYSIETPDGASYSDIKFHWLNNDEYLVYDKGFESLGGNIHKINLRTGQSTLLYPGPFLNFAYNPNKDEFLFLERPDDYFGWEPEVPDGVYRIDSNTGEKEMVLPGSYRTLSYNEHFNLYAVNSDDNSTVIYFDEKGITCSREGSDYAEYSPNDEWALNSINGVYHLFNSSCQLIMKTEYRGEELWLRDSSGFQIHGDVIVRFLEENNWQPEIINEHPAFDGFDNVIFP